MASFINFTQVNQHFDKLTTYGGIAPLAQSKWFIGEKDQDPKVQPIDVFIIDNDGNKQILAQPIETDAIGNFINKTDQTPSPIYPQIDQSFYSLLIEIEVEGETITYQWQSVTAEISDDEKYQQKADLIDLENVKPTDDLIHNAPTAKSTIDKISTSLNGILRVSDLSDSTTSTATNIPANSKAVNDLRLLAYSLTQSYQHIKILTDTSKNLNIDMSDVNGIIRVIGIGGGGAGGQGFTYKGNTPGLLPITPSAGGAGGLFDVIIKTHDVNTICAKIGKAGIGSQSDFGDRKGEDTLFGTGFNNLGFAWAYGGMAGSAGGVEINNTIRLGKSIGGGYMIHDNNAEFVFGSGQIGALGEYNRYYSLTSNDPATGTLLCKSEGPTGANNESGRSYNSTFLKFYGAGGDAKDLWQSSTKPSEFGGDGKDGVVIIFSNQEIPDPA